MCFKPQRTHSTTEKTNKQEDTKKVSQSIWPHVDGFQMCTERSDSTTLNIVFSPVVVLEVGTSPDARGQSAVTDSRPPWSLKSLTKESNLSYRELLIAGLNGQNKEIKSLWIHSADWTLHSGWTHVVNRQVNTHLHVWSSDRGACVCVRRGNKCCKGCCWGLCVCGCVVCYSIVQRLWVFFLLFLLLRLVSLYLLISRTSE